MYLFKQSFALLAIFAVLFVTSCQTTDDTCTPPALEENIKGTWTAIWENNAEVKFMANGQLSDPSNAILGGEVNGVQLTVKTYEVRANNKLYVKAEAPNAPNTYLDTTIPVTKNECNTLTLEFAGIGVKLKRK